MRILTFLDVIVLCLSVLVAIKSEIWHGLVLFLAFMVVELIGLIIYGSILEKREYDVEQSTMSTPNKKPRS